ncbi:MAG TPA: hypothetical protein VGT24_01635 [Candidatus Acidoferrales bacterium]|nr:hypothetical protein [Candidatus Acidoferrales bacterium]
MTDTLKSIAEGMEHTPDMMEYHEPRPCLPTCDKCRLLALVAEYEKVDLVQRWRNESCGLPKYRENDMLLTCADELVIWLAANVERIKAEARREERDWWVKKRIAAELEAQKKPEERTARP